MDWGLGIGATGFAVREWYRIILGVSMVSLVASERAASLHGIIGTGADAPVETVVWSCDYQ